MKTKSQYMSENLYNEFLQYYDSYTDMEKHRFIRRVKYFAKNNLDYNDHNSVYRISRIEYWTNKQILPKHL